MENEEQDKSPVVKPPERSRQGIKRGLSKPAETTASAATENAIAEMTTTPTRQTPARQAARVKFPELAAAPTGGGLLRPELFGHIPVKVTVEMGEATINLKEVLDLAEGSLITLDRLAGQPLDLKIKDQLIARGEVVVVDDNYGLRITEIASDD